MIETKVIENSIKDEESEKPIRMVVVWRNIFAFVLMHYMAVKAFFPLEIYTLTFQYIYGFTSAMGIVAGAHRLWAHRSFKANYTLQLLLMILHTISMQNHIIEWVRDHRVHHKYSETNADPHSAARGFFFAHMGWLIVKKHPDVRKYGKKVDISDVENDPLLKFQKKYYYQLIIVFSFLIPIFFTMYFFNSTFMYSFYCAMSRYVVLLHLVWLTNSASHYGSWKPYDKNIMASDSYSLGTICFGEGWHNFHHTFPWDYRLSEHSRYVNNAGFAFIDFFAKIGWATDLKIASEEMIRKRVIRTGDGTHPYSIEAAKMRKKTDNVDDTKNKDEHKQLQFWGLGDDDITADDMKDITTLN